MGKLMIERKNYIEAVLDQSCESCQLIIPLQGSLTFEIAGEKLCDDEQKILIIPPNRPYRLSSQDQGAYLIMKIPKRILNRVDFREISQGYAFKLDNRWMAIRALILEEVYAGVDETNLKSLLKYIDQFIDENGRYASVKYIHEHYDEAIDIKTLAELENYTASYYSEWFKCKIGMKPKKYIQKIRLERASALLLETDYSIAQIALMVGYRHHESLTRIFKNVYGISPADFRKTQQ